MVLTACAGSADVAPTAPVRSAAVVGAPASLNARFRAPTLTVDRWTKRFEGESREVYRARVEIVKALGLRPGQVVADVGAGTGLFVKYLAEAVGTFAVASRSGAHLGARPRGASAVRATVAAPPDDWW